MKKKDETTEEKIKQTAARLFIKKGYKETSVRDIATEAGINLASMNYYFRSKEKLFEMIMMDTIRDFLEKMVELLNKADLSFDERVELFATRYIDLMTRQPDLPLFIMSELRTHPESFIKKLGISGVFTKLKFLEELAAQNKTNSPTVPMQMFISLMGMTIFPFIARPMLQAAAGMSQKQFTTMMEERKALIPFWLNELIKTMK